MNCLVKNNYSELERKKCVQAFLFVIILTVSEYNQVNKNEGEALFMKYKDSGEFSVCEWRSDVYTETGADYVLPDYNGDVRKILYTEAKVRPSGNFENDGNIDFSGIIVYNMVYSDSENRINSVSFTSDYDFSVKCNSETYLSAIADTSIANYAMRLLGPRKISAKATLSSRVVLENKESYPISGSAFETGVPEVQSKFVSVAKASRSENIEREYAEELIRLDGKVSDEVEVVFSDAECVVDSVSADEGGAQIKGSVRVTALVKCDGEPIQLVEKNIRIDENVPFDGAESAIRTLPRASASSVRCNVTADESGCSVVTNVIVDLFVESYENEQVKLITDAYRCDCDTDNEYDDYKYYELETVLTEKEDLSFVVPRDSIEVENLRDIICFDAKIKVTDSLLENGACTISGEVNYSGIAFGIDDKGNLSYQPFKHTAEFAKNVNINCQNEDKIKLIPIFECVDATATVDENNLYLGCRAYMKLTIISEKCQRVLTSSELVSGGEFEEIGSKIVVYYPENGETLFEIAKKFHTTVEKISADNSVSCSVSASEDSAVAERLILF